MQRMLHKKFRLAHCKQQPKNLPLVLAILIEGTFRKSGSSALTHFYIEMLFYLRVSVVPFS